MSRTAGPDQEPVGSAASTWRSLVEAAGLAWVSAPGALVARVVLAVVSGLIPLSVAWLTKVVLDRLASPGRPLLGAVVLLAATGIVAVMAPQVVRFVETDMRRSIALTVKQRLYAAVGRLDGLRRFEDPVFHDRLQLAGSSATTGPSDLMTSALGVAQGVLGVAGFVVALGILNPWMPLIIAVAAVPTARAELLLSRRRAAMLWGLSHAARREFFYTGILTSAQAAQEVRLYGLGDLFGTRMVRELRTINELERRLDRHELYVQVALGFCGALVAGGGLIWAVEQARVGALTIGDVSVFVAAVAGVQGGLSLLVSHFGEAHQATLLFGHYQYVIGAGPDLPSPPTVRPAPPLRRGVELRDVWFRYGDDLPWVLRGVNLTIPAGRATALVGLNGAGKSTLVKLLCRFYDPTRGSITWDGDDIRTLSIADLRRRLGVVFQEFMTYDLSVSENIGVGDVEAIDDQPRIEAAARRAGCHETLAALPRGYQTMLTRIYVDNADRDDPSTGVVLSGGQWQRVALARGILRDDCDLLILDEPSAGLDAEAEHQVHQQLRAHRAGRTSLLISHRLNTVRDADSIVVLRDGAIAESGDHVTLIAGGGVYADLFGLQASGYADSEPGEADQDSGTPRPMNRFVVPVAGLAVVGLGVVLVVLRRSLVAVLINGSSMEPTYRSGDRVLVRRRGGAVRVGEVVVMERPGSSGGWPMPPLDGDLHRREWIIKRVVAAAGDPVPPEVVPALLAGAGATVPEGMVVVLGDAGGRSLDSRYIGFVPVGRILGIALRTLPT